MNVYMKSASLVVGVALALSACTKPAAEKSGTPELREASHMETSAETRESEGSESKEAGEAEETTVKLEGEALEHAGIKTLPVGNRQVATVLTTTGEVVSNPDREARVTPRTVGRVVRVLKSVGDRVESGETLAILDSVELGQAQADYLEVHSRYRLAEKVLARHRKLFSKDLIAQKEVQAAENELEVSQITLEKARNKLELFGLTSARIKALTSSRKLDPTIPLLAPISGVVTAKNVTVGEVIQPEAAEPTFMLADTSVLWVNANLYEKDLVRVHEAQVATVTTGAYGSRSFPGRVARIHTALDPATRTAKARIVLSNPGGKLKPEMFVSVNIHVGSQEALAIPVAAVLQEKGERFAFVKEGEGVYEKRPLKLGEKAGDYYPVLGGVESGDQVVVSGGFTLKSELLKESFGEEE